MPTMMHESEPQRDFLAHCVAATTGNPLLEEIRNRSAEAVLAVYRTIKNALVHAIDNDAMRQTAQQSAEILRGFAQEVGSGAVITFAGDTVFVCGQLLRAQRKVYEATVELGKLFARCDVSEVSFEDALSDADLLAFAAAVATTLRDPERRDALTKTKLNHVSVRKVEPILTRRQDDAELPVQERILRLYANALLVMRQFYDSIAHGTTILPHRVKRLAQRLVTLSETNHPALLGMTAMAHAHRDDAGRAVQSAILAVVVARQITTDRVALARLAMTALMADSGRIRLLGPKGRDRFVTLSEQLEACVPPMTGIVCIATGGINVASAMRTVSSVETTWIERKSLLGPVYGGKLSPLVQSQILRIVRRLLEYVAPRDASRPMAPADALQALFAEPDVDRVLLKLVVRAVGVIPVGSVVEFETGEWAVVIAPSQNAEAAHLPLVRLVTDRSGHALERPRDVDLGTAAASPTFPRIKHIVSPEEARFNVTRTFIV
jgi:hypothetical protein